ncbi:FUSC family protein [Methanosphaerula palustris]|uniref:Integral membrane bound transporter domain-containing protein n=1 Tax=Methanosphaerula palustris (strain ATCC BAA-1556 / DSM 19958 / E1-9c) TaxID=521011 RepID=B8GEP1_METPE|nr:FUSC family protein [Methanosphaerula palustris]ACL17742.1 hypothetical protein Mpal_2466 [Methanosphaerula palustris E1-9c]
MNALTSLPEAVRSILVDAVRWSREIPVPVSQSVAVALGMAVPIAVGVAIDQIGLGMLASLGGLAASGAAGTLREQGILLCSALVTGCAAVLVGSTIAGHGWMTGAAIVLITTIAALVGSLGRTFARSTTVFTIFMIIGTSLGISGALPPIDVTLVFAAGAAWTVIVSLLASSLFRALGREGLTAGTTVIDQQPAPITLRRRFRRWFRSLQHLAGWQYTLRISLCILVSEIIAVLWDQPWSYWIPLVVVIILQRNIETTLARASQRALGTCAGVIIGSVLLSKFTPIWFLILMVGILAAVRPILRVRNYTLYTVVMTPLIIILLEFGSTLSSGVLAYRLVDTAIGFIIVVVFGYLLWPVLLVRSPMPVTEPGS